MIILLGDVTTIDRATDVMKRALRVSDLLRATTLTEAQLVALLQVITAEGGAVGQLAEDMLAGGLWSERGLHAQQKAA